jgi:hypothetical protein
MGESAAKYRPELDLDEFERRLRAAAPSAQPRQPAASAPDPLAELARLVSGAGEGRQDPFAALFRAQKAVAQGQADLQADLHAHFPPPPAPPPFPQQGQAIPPLPSPRDPYFAGQSAPHHANPHFAAETDPQWVEEPARVDAPWASQAAEFAPEPQAFAPQAERSGGRRKVVYAMAAVLFGGIGVFVGGLALKKGGSTEAPLIQADNAPAKVKPTAQEAAGASAGQALFDRKDDNAPAKAVSKTEQPADLVVAAKQAAASVPTPTPPAPTSAAPQAAAQHGDGLMAPRKVKTVSIRADGSLLNAPAAEKPKSTLPTMAAGLPGVTPPVVPAARPAAPRAPSTTEAALQAQKPKAKPEAKPEPAAVADPAASGDWAVQLAGAPSEAEARAAATKFSERYGSALQGRHPTFVSAEKDGKSIYRVRVGRLSKEAANGMCNAIKGKGGACFIVKN